MNLIYDSTVFTLNIYFVQSERKIDISSAIVNGAITLKGTPVSAGKVEARVCVAPNIEDAVNLKVSYSILLISININESSDSAFLLMFSRAIF